MNGLTIEELQHFPLGWKIRGYHLVQIRGMLTDKKIRIQWSANNENSYTVSDELLNWLCLSKLIYDNRYSNQGSAARYRATLIKLIDQQANGYRYHMKIPGPKWNREGGLALEITFPKKLSRIGPPCCALQFGPHWCNKVLEHQFLSDGSSVHLCACGEKERSQ